MSGSEMAIKEALKKSKCSYENKTSTSLSWVSGREMLGETRMKGHEAKERDGVEPQPQESLQRGMVQERVCMCWPIPQHHYSSARSIHLIHRIISTDQSPSFRMIGFPSSHQLATVSAVSHMGLLHRSGHAQPPQGR